MALTRCPECAETVSTEATACPHCGFPIKEDPVLDYAERRLRLGYSVAWTTLVVAVVLGVLAVFDYRLIGYGVVCLLCSALAFVILTIKKAMLDKSKTRRDEPPRRKR